ncbi:MAG: hypothetical protein LLG44_09645 [Chloroflexi bacterium]|nr:hypothetical protein [Chloroflexota bacterium]
MVKSFNYLTGIWIGANIVALPLVFIGLLMATDKIPVPTKTGGELLEVDEAIAQAKALASQIPGGVR